MSVLEHDGRQVHPYMRPPRMNARDLESLAEWADCDGVASDILKDKRNIAKDENLANDIMRAKEYKHHGLMIPGATSISLMASPWRNEDVPMALMDKTIPVVINMYVANFQTVRCTYSARYFRKTKAIVGAYAMCTHPGNLEYLRERFRQHTAQCSSDGGAPYSLCSCLSQKEALMGIHFQIVKLNNEMDHDRFLQYVVQNIQ